MRIADQVVATDAFDGDNLAVVQCFDGRCQGVRSGERGTTYIDLRPAIRACGRFRMKPTIAGRCIFRRAAAAEWKAGHAGICPVIWIFFDQRVARAALRAVDERVTETIGSGIGHFGKAIGTGRLIW